MSRERLGPSPLYCHFRLATGSSPKQQTRSSRYLRSFAIGCRPGRVDVGFLGAAQIDKYGNINTTIIGGTYDAPEVRLPGAGGAPEIATSSKEVWIVLKQNKRTFVDQLHFVTSAGHRPSENGLPGNGNPWASHLRGKGPTVVITDLGVLAPDPKTSEFTLTALHPGVTLEQARAATGWELKLAPQFEVTPAPTELELKALRDLYARTEAAHGAASTDA